MQLYIDTDSKSLTQVSAEGKRELSLYSTEAFQILSDMWVKVGWNQKYPYTFTWMGRPLIQLPEDVLRIQEVIYRLRPDFVIETGVAHGGSLVFYASLLEAMGHGRVIGIDIEIRPHNRASIESHEMFHRIDLIEGSSTAPEVVADVKSRIAPGSKVLVILDSNHSRAHVTQELLCYHDLVSIGSYIVATDGVMQWVHDVPRGLPSWVDDNPTEAAIDFAASHPSFKIENPPWSFNESDLHENVTHWPGAWLKKVY